jgi:ketosteroid isomerase-like protein
MSPDEKVAVLRKIFAEFAESGSVEGLLEILTEDVVYRVTVGEGTPLSGEFVGIEGVRRYFEGMPAAVEHLGFNVYDFLANEDTAVVTGDETLRVVRNGAVFSSDWAVVCRYRGDKVRSVVVIENLGPLSAAYAS